VNDALGHPQTALVLGGGSDIALATVRRLAEQRLRSVVLAGRDTAALEQQAAELRRSGLTDVSVVAFDATDTDSHESVIGGAFERLGDVDVVLVAFGVLGEQEKAELDPRAAAAIATTNYVGVVSSGIAASTLLRAQGHGTLVLLSSVAGERVRRSNFIYGSSKAGADGFAQGLGDALVGSGARVLIVRPGFVKTKMTQGMDPVPFSTTPDEVAAAIVRALETKKEIVWAPPVLRYVMMALRHVPRVVFRRLPL
jgi:decaprenylphospho-beta-D-erythro-pentofuranosid-2-ulose 2-reductase